MPIAFHIPDGFLSTEVVMGLLGALLAGLVFGWAQPAMRTTRPVFLALVAPSPGQR